MLTITEVREELDLIIEKIPEEILRGLNGGIILLPDIKLHPKSAKRDYYILGEYHFDPNGFGRYIVIYYGSFRLTHGFLSETEQIKKLEEILYHELTHHIEHLAGDVSLEIKDAEDFAKYLRRYKHKGENGD